MFVTSLWSFRLYALIIRQRCDEIVMAFSKFDIRLFRIFWREKTAP